MVRAAFILVLGLLAAPFFSAVSLACDGVNPTCPATQETGTMWRYNNKDVTFCGTSYPASSYIYSDASSAAAAACSQFSAAATCELPKGNVTCSGGITMTVIHKYTPGSCSISGSTATTFNAEANYTRQVISCSTTSSNYSTTLYGRSEENQTVYRCDNPLYPVGPDAQHLCHMSTCPRAGSAYQPAVYNPIAPTSLCLNMPNGSKCGFNFGGISGSTPLYTSTGEGCECSQAMQDMGACGTYQNQPPTDDNGCVLMSDGVRACPADPSERCRVAGTANGQPVTVCDQGCGYFGAGDSADNFMCLEEDPPQACTAGDTRPQCQNQNPGDCPQGAETCDKPNFPPCVEGDTRPECAGLNPGDCPPGKDCSTGGVDDDSSLQGVNRRLDQGNENTKGMLDILRKWDNAKPTEEQTNAPVTAGNSVYEEKLQEAEGQFSTVGEGDKDAALADISGNQGGFVAAVSAMLPQPTGCAPMTISIPGYNYSWDWCHLLDMFRLFAEWVLMFVVAAYIFNDIREQGKRTV